MALKRKKACKLFTEQQCGGGAIKLTAGFFNLKRHLLLPFCHFPGAGSSARSLLMINSKVGRQIKHLKVYETSGKTDDGIKAPREKRGIRSREGNWRRI